MVTLSFQLQGVLGTCPPSTKDYGKCILYIGIYSCRVACEYLTLCENWDWNQHCCEEFWSEPLSHWSWHMQGWVREEIWGWQHVNGWTAV